MLEDPAVLVQKILEGFDPENDKMDRRILYEVTGLALIKDEFLDDDSSDSDKELPLEDDGNDPQYYAFNYRQVGDTEGITAAINP